MTLNLIITLDFKLIILTFHLLTMIINILYLVIMKMDNKVKV